MNSQITILQFINHNLDYLLCQNIILIREEYYINFGVWQCIFKIRYNDISSIILENFYSFVMKSCNISNISSLLPFYYHHQKLISHQYKTTALGLNQSIFTTIIGCNTNTYHIKKTAIFESILYSEVESKSPWIYT